MHSIIRVMGVVNRTPPANPMAALEDILDTLAQEPQVDIVLLPRLALCPPSSARLLRSKVLQKACSDALEALAARSKELPGYIVLTAHFFRGGVAREEAVVLCGGEMYRWDPAQEGPLPLFQCGELYFSVLPGPPGEMPLRLPQIAGSGCALLLSPCYEPVFAGSVRSSNLALAAVSASARCAVVAVNGGVGDTSSPSLYQGYVSVAEEGLLTAFKPAEMSGVSLCYDVDNDLIAPLRQATPAGEPRAVRPCIAPKNGLLRPLSATPYLPMDEGECCAYLDEIFRYQARALASRLDNIGVGRMVLGVSGGLDSTLALLVCAAACDLLGLGRGSILGVTMPGFGTSDRTYFNALQLMEQLGCETRDIPIRNAVSSHFEDIAHNPALQDLTYENAQARERAQILFDLSNQEGALVVGTGDLSEAALGFSTFGGDHLAGYNVNITLNKTTIRALVRYIAKGGLMPEAAETLLDILDTPISPELLPPDENGDPLQKSEEILGPYALHDFFLHYTLKYSLSPLKVYNYALISFGEEFEADFILEKLKVFLRRFYAAQFKRSCAPDSASLCRPNLNGYRIPSDLNPQVFLGDLQG